MKKKQKQAIEKNLKQICFTKCLHFLETADPGTHLEKTLENKSNYHVSVKPLRKLISLLNP